MSVNARAQRASKRGELWLLQRERGEGLERGGKRGKGAGFVGGGIRGSLMDTRNSDSGLGGPEEGSSRPKEPGHN